MVEKGLIKEKDKAPDVSGFAFYIDSFSELNSCRASAMQGVSPIPFTAIVEYSKIYEVEDFHEFHYYMRVMDNALVDFEHSKMSQSHNKPKAGKK